jgi:hypothetical protein
MVPAVSYSQVAVAKYAGEFLAIGVGGRALGMGGAYAALANDVTAGYWNPAGLAHVDYPEVTLMHDEQFAGLINYDYGAAAMPVGVNSTLGLSAIRMGVDNIANTQNAGVDANGDPIPAGSLTNLDHIDPSKVTYFNSADWAFFVSYAKRATEDFSYGANLKIIRCELGTASASGLGFDLGAQYRVGERFLLGANFQDVTTTLVAWSTGTNELISPTLKLGAGYYLDALGGRFTPAFDVDLRGENRETESNYHIGALSMDFHSGIEFDYQHAIAIRTGWSDIGALTVGAGIHLPKFDIDYSFAKFDATDDLGNSNRISLTFILQAPQYVRSSGAE